MSEKRNPILIGKAKSIPVPMRVGQIRLDIAGKLGIIICQTPDGWGVQVNELMTQIVPLERQELFEQTTECLGEL